MRHHCGECNSQRQGETCWKCGAATFEPDPRWDYPELPEVAPIRALAKEAGYAIGEHGSKERDLDLIAAPWREDAVDAIALIHHIAQGLGAKVREIEEKPLGRTAATIQMHGWYKDIDLSVCPIIKKEA